MDQKQKPGRSGKASYWLAASLIMFAGAPTAQAAVATYGVAGVFFEPMTQNAGGNTVFTGTFDWDASTNTLSNLAGVMNSSMVSAVQNLSLAYNLATSIDGNGIVTASVFKENTTDVFAGGGYATGNIIKYGTTGAPMMGVPADGNIANQNAYFSFSFDSATMAGLTDSIVYGDCTANGLMMAGQMCMTGHSAGGTMNAVPSSLNISQVSAVPVPAAAWLFGSALAGMLGASRRKRALLV